MSSHKNKTVLVYDNGLFVELAITLAKDFKRVLYFAPWVSGYPRSNMQRIGQGIEEIERVNDIWEHINEVDLFVFPDVYEAGLQEYLVSIGKRVWGCRGGAELELDRIASKEQSKKLGIDIGPYQLVVGLDALRLHLKKHDDQWVKISATRGDCFDDQTEIFTHRGWVLFDDLTEDDEVITMDVETSETTFVRPTAKIKYRHDGRMVRINGRQNSIDALVTTNHCFWAKTIPSAPWRYQGLPSLRRHAFRIPQAFKWTGSRPTDYRIENVYPTSTKEARVVDIRDWLEFLGWFVSEGALTLAGAKGDKYRINVAQSLQANPLKHADVLSCLSRLGYNLHREGDFGFSIYDKSLFLELEATCYNGPELRSHCKRVPNFVKQLAPDLIEIFLDSYRKGDGSVDKRSGQVRYYTNSKALADDIQELVFKSGKAASISISGKEGEIGGKNKQGLDIIARHDTYCVGVKTVSPYLTIKPQQISDEDYHGYVYDVTVEPYHSIFVRRNGRAFWSGNCETFHSPTYAASEQRLDELEHSLGAKKKIMEFIVEQGINPAVEVGYDGYTIDGKYPNGALVGVEVKDKAYLGKTMRYAQLPEQVRSVNDKLAPALKKYGYRGFISTEIRCNDDGAYLIDPCARCGSPPSELYQVMIENLGEILWEGADGIVIEPEYKAKWGAMVLLLSDWADSNWQHVSFPAEVRENVKLRNMTIIDGEYYVIPQGSGMPEIGAVVAMGDTAKQAIEECKRIADLVEGHMIDKPLSALDDAQADLAKVLGPSKPVSKGERKADELRRQGKISDKQYDRMLARQE